MFVRPNDKTVGDYLLIIEARVISTHGAIFERSALRGIPSGGNRSFVLIDYPAREVLSTSIQFLPHRGIKVPHGTNLD